MRRLLPLLLLALACGEDVPQAAALEVGTGSWRFEALEDGQEVELIRGAQGGWHVWVSFRVRGVDMDPVPVTLSMQPADEGREPYVTDVALRFDPEDREGWRKTVGWTGILPDPACVVGELLRIEASLAMPDGELLRSERDVLVRGGTYPPGPCEEE
ncbi:MAG: hypothetical protein AAGH15_14840 [Myxococcota bacterium]